MIDAYSIASISGKENAGAFRSAQPFPHIVMDGFIDPGVLSEINAEWPGAGWTQHVHGHSRKRAFNAGFGPWTRALIDCLHGPDVIADLAALAGIPDLSADPSLIGGGLHECFPGGFLDIHADFNIHPETRLHRRLNLLLYLNERWEPEWNGALELWARDKSRCLELINPLGGRCVIFATSDSSFHGHPAPLACPEDVSRRSLALYYYSTQPAESEPREHSMLYVGDEENWFPTGEVPGESPMEGDLD